MELITTETRRAYKWYFEDGVYISKDGDKINAKVYGVDLANPDTIRTMRHQTQKRLPLHHRGLYRVEPDEVTKALWNDWQRRQSMG